TNRCTELAPSTSTLQAQFSHDSLDSLVVHLRALPPELRGHPRCSVAPAGAGPGVVDAVGQDGLVPRRVIGARRLGRGPRVVRRAGHLAHPAQRLDLELGLLAVDEAIELHAFDSFTQKAVARF